MGPGAADLTLRWPERYGPDHAGRWMEPLRQSLSRLVTVRPKAIAQTHRRVTVIEAELGGATHRVALDFSDYADELAADLVASCPAYFKMQHLREGYGHPHVVPGGYVAGRPHIYGLLPRARAIADRGAFRYEVYGRFGAGFAREERRRAVETLRSQDRFSYEGDLRLVTYARFLREAARSRVCVDLPGNGDICHRLVDYLGVGACVVGIRPHTTLHVPLEPGRHITYARRDMTDLVDACAGLLGDPPRRDAQAAAAREFFDRYLHVDQLAGYYLHRLLALLGAPRG